LDNLSANRANLGIPQQSDVDNVFNLIKNHIGNIYYPEFDKGNVSDPFNANITDASYFGGANIFDPKIKVDYNRYYTCGELKNIMKEIMDMDINNNNTVNPQVLGFVNKFNRNGYSAYLGPLFSPYLYLLQSVFTNFDFEQYLKNKINPAKFIQIIGYDPNTVPTFNFRDILTSFEYLCNQEKLKDNDTLLKDQKLKYNFDSFVQLKSNPQINHINNILLNIHPPQPVGNGTEILSSEFNFYIWRLKNVVGKLKESKNDIINKIKNNNSNNFAEVLNEELAKIMTQIVNLGIILKYLKNSYDKIKKIFDVTEDGNFDAKMNNLRSKINGAFLINILNESTMDFKSTVNALNIENMIKEIYKDVILGSFRWIQSIIKQMEDVSFAEAFKMFHGANFDRDKMNAVGLSNGIISHQYIFMDFPKTMADFSDFTVPDFRQLPAPTIEKNLRRIKRSYFERYIPQLDPTYSVNYITQVAQVPPNKKSVFGYLVDHVEHRHYVDGMNDSINSPYGLAGTNPETITRIGYKTYQFGEIGVGDGSGTTNKNNVVFPLLFSQDYGKYHIGMLKYRIIVDLLSKIYKTIIDPIATLPPLKKNMQINIKNFEKTIKNQIQDDHKATLIMIGTYIKNSIENKINDFIITGSNKVILDKINKHYPALYDPLYQNLSTTIPTGMSSSYRIDLEGIYNKLIKTDIVGHLTDKFDEIGTITQGKLNEPTVDNYKNKVHRIVNSNYREIESWPEVCYIVDYGIIDLLATNEYIDMNIRGTDDRSPIFKAIEMKNKEAILRLRANKATTTQKDINKKTPLQYALNKYKKSIDTKHVNIYDLCDEVTNDTFDDFKNRYDNNLPINAGIIFKIALHMLNHHFFNLAGKYYGEWNYNSFIKLRENLEKDKLEFKSIFPFLDVELTKEEFARLDIYNQKVKKSSKDIEQLSKEIAELEEVIKNLDGEESYVKSKTTKTDFDKERLRNIKAMKAQFNAQKVAKDAEKIANQTNKTTIEGNTQIAFNNEKTEFDNNKQKYIASFNTNNYNTIFKLYDSVFSDILNHNKRKQLKQKEYDHDANYMTYPNMWRKYLSNTKDNLDYTVFMEVLNSYQQKLLDDPEDNKSHDDIKKLLEDDPVFIFYNKIIYPYVNNYIKLPKELGGVNSCLDNIMGIIEHIIKRCVLVPFYYEIIGNVIAYLQESLVKDGEVNRDMIVNYLDAVFKSNNISNYIFAVMPLKLVKKILDIYDEDDENDPANDGKTVDDLFNEILKKIGSTSGFQLNDQTPLMSAIRDKTIPKYKEYIKLSINTLYKLMNNYLYYLYDQSRDIDILFSLL
jgi:hypothetical protein